MDLLPSIILFGIVAAFTPGPNNIMIMASGLNFGVRASMPHFFGICFGFTAMFFTLGFGLGYVFELYPRLHEFIKVFGVVYLLWLAWLIANSAPSSKNNSASSKPLTFMRAALFQWLNPKAWVMVSGAIATFTSAGENIDLQILLIGAVFFLCTFPSAGTWLYFGHLLGEVINNPKQQKIFNVAMALLLLLSILPIVLDMIDSHLI